MRTSDSWRSETFARSAARSASSALMRLAIAWGVAAAGLHIPNSTSWLSGISQVHHSSPGAWRRAPGRSPLRSLRRMVLMSTPQHIAASAGVSHVSAPMEPPFTSPAPPRLCVLTSGAFDPGGRNGAARLRILLCVAWATGGHRRSAGGKIRSSTGMRSVR